MMTSQAPKEVLKSLATSLHQHSYYSPSVQDIKADELDLQLCQNPTKDDLWEEWYKINGCKLTNIVEAFTRRYGLPDMYAEDVMQDTLIGLLSSLVKRNFQPGKQSLCAYATGIARHNTSNISRQYSKANGFSCQNNWERDCQIQGSHHYVEDAEDLPDVETLNFEEKTTDYLAEVNWAMRKIKPIRKLVIEMHIMQGLSYKSIAKQLEKSEVNVRALFSRGVRDVRKILESKENS